MGGPRFGEIGLLYPYWEKISGDLCRNFDPKSPQIGLSTIEGGQDEGLSIWGESEGMFEVGASRSILGDHGPLIS
jgi:hypothetical protein